MKKRSILALALLTIVFLFPTSISAATTNGEKIEWNKKMTSGSSINYYLYAGVEYTNTIPRAVNKLMYSKDYFGDTTFNNNLYLYETTNYMSSKMDFKQEYVQNTINAKTSSHRKNSSGVYYAMNVYDKDIYDWVYATVTINDYNMAPMENWQREAVIVHEMLHGYGMRDLTTYANRFNIMSGSSYYWRHNNLSYPNAINSFLNSKYWQREGIQYEKNIISATIIYNGWVLNG